MGKSWWIKFEYSIIANLLGGNRTRRREIWFFACWFYNFSGKRASKEDRISMVWFLEKCTVLLCTRVGETRSEAFWTCTVGEWKKFQNFRKCTWITLFDALSILWGDKESRCGSICKINGTYMWYRQNRAYSYYNASRKWDRIVRRSKRTWRKSRKNVCFFCSGSISWIFKRNLCRTHTWTC